jgi:hypothetical protein
VQEINVFVLGLDEANEEQLRADPNSEQFRFHPLLSVSELQEGELPIDDLLDKARETLSGFDGEIGAIVGFWDFPVSSMVPILCAEYGLPSASLRAVVTCEHKYWSRLEQRKVIDELPGFDLVDLEGDPEPPAGLRFPMWLKPIKGFSSELAYLVQDAVLFSEAVAAIREGIGRVGEPFQHVLDRVDLPPEIARVGGQACLAEEAMSGEQVATEGYVHQGEVAVYGVLDSVDYPDSSAFLRHQYPSQLPEETQQRLRDISRRVIEQIGLDNATFSVEFFHDPESGDVKILEINPRHSQSHAALFRHVDGVPNHHVMLSLALGRDPRFEKGQGPYEIAAKCYLRRFADGVIGRVPSEEEIADIERQVGGVTVRPVPEQGQQLSEMDAQDSYSYELAEIEVAAGSVEELEEKYQRVVDALDFQIEDVEAPEGH